jgi:N-acetylneuraminic acid mutarotase
MKIISILLKIKMKKTVITIILIITFLVASFLATANPAFGATVTENTWVTKTSLPTARSRLGVAVVNGKIYAIGGFPDYGNNEEYDPATNTWTTKASIPTPRYLFGIAVYQNKVYCIGGQFNNRSTNARLEYTGAIEVYDPATNTWETKEPMPNPRSQFQANVVYGKIYLMGGKTGGQNSTVSLNDVYDPETESWTTKASMPYPVVSYASAVVDSRIFVFDGQDEFNGTLNLSVTQIYDTKTDMWSFGKPLPTSVWRSAACVTSGVYAPQRIYVIGGQPSNSGGATIITQIYDPSSDYWSAGASMPTARFDLALAAVSDKIYAIGGTGHYIFPNEEANDDNEMYIPIGYNTPVKEPEPYDGTPPQITIVSPENKTYYTTDLPLNFSVNEPVSWVSYKLDNETEVKISGNITITGLSFGSHSLTFYASDYADNKVSQTIYFTIAEEPEPEPQQSNPSGNFPAALITTTVVSVAVIGICLLVYFKKRKHNP